MCARHTSRRRPAKSIVPSVDYNADFAVTEPRVPLLWLHSFLWFCIFKSTKGRAEFHPLTSGQSVL